MTVDDHRRSTTQDGSAALETVLVLPVVALLLVALLGSVAVVDAQLSVTQAARAAARAVALDGDVAAGRRVAAGRGGDVTVSVEVRQRVAYVAVSRRAALLGLSHELRATAVAPLEPVVP